MSPTVYVVFVGFSCHFDTVKDGCAGAFTVMLNVAVFYAAFFVRHGHCLCSRRTHVRSRQRVFTACQYFVCAAIGVVRRYFQSRSIKRIAYRRSSLSAALLPPHTLSKQARGAYRNINVAVLCRLLPYAYGNRFRSCCTPYQAESVYSTACQHLVRAAVGIMRGYFQSQQHQTYRPPCNVDSSGLPSTSILSRTGTRYSTVMSNVAVFFYTILFIRHCNRLRSLPCAHIRCRQRVLTRLSAPLSAPLLV